MDKVRSLFRDRVTLSLVIVIVLVLVSGFLVYQKFFAGPSVAAQEVDLAFDPEGPYALLSPRRDGNALVLDLKRTSSYDSISYELAYTSSDNTVAVTATKSADESGSGGGSIDRGVVGNIDTKAKKNEYIQEILFGTCSKNVCKYDKGVENGTLTLHIKKGSNAYRMITQWHLQKPDVALGQLASGDSHFKYTAVAQRQDLAILGYSIINDLTGVPKLPDGKMVLGKVYALNLPDAKELMAGTVTVELADKPGANIKIARYSNKDNQWQQLDTKVNGSTLTTQAPSGGIFAVLVDKK